MKDNVIKIISSKFLNSFLVLIIQKLRAIINRMYRMKINDSINDCNLIFEKKLKIININQNKMPALTQYSFIQKKFLL